MGKQVEQNIWSVSGAQETKRLALDHARHIQNALENNFFDEANFTVGIEQEGFVIDQSTGEPLNVEPFIYHNTVGVRPETAVHAVEYDIGGIISLDLPSLEFLFSNIHQPNQRIQAELNRIYGQNALLVNSGTCPLLFQNWKEFVLSDKEKRFRYDQLENIFSEENEVKQISFFNVSSQEEYKDRATNLSANTRCFATQLHFGFPTFQETLQAYNISVAITGPLMALFANSPFIAGINTGFASARIELLQQCEQKRYRQAQYAESFFDHVQKEVCNLPAFVSTTPLSAFQNTYSAEHITTRICLDEDKKTSRIEIRGMDSMNPEKVRSAVIVCLGLLFGLLIDELPTQEEVNHNFQEGRKGIQSVFLWNGKIFSYQDTWHHLFSKVREGLTKINLLEFGEPYIFDLENQVKENRNDATQFVDLVESLEHLGLSRKEVLRDALVLVSSQYYNIYGVSETPIQSSVAEFS